MTERRCDKCEFWRKRRLDRTGDGGVCYRLPVNVGAPKDHWCGEFKGKAVFPEDLLTFKQAREMAFLRAWEYCGGDIPKMAVVLNISRPTVKAYYNSLKPIMPRSEFKEKE